VTIPLAATGAQAIATDPAPPLPSRPLRLLLVEDHPVNQRVAMALLRRDGHTVAVANDGREALVHHQAGAWDAILMDIQMPVMDGIEAATEIRQRERGRHRTPIIALTASSMPDEVARCRAAGMDSVLAKPIDLAALRRILAEIPG
jgi:CheY-like chemotaxis protein